MGSEKKELTKIATDEYRFLASRFHDFGYHVKEIQNLKLELCNEYGVTELEAINILQGYHINDYLLKYEHKRNGVEIKKTNKKEVETEDTQIVDDWLYQRLLELEDEK